MMAELAVRDRQRSRRRLLSSAGLAAVLAIGVGIYFGASRRPERPAAARLASGFESVRLLPDGTIVELNANADLAVRFEPALRRVELRAGEALFHVAKNPARPFVVRAGGVDVRAVGTAFNVRLDASVVDVIVTEGKVGLEEAVHGASLLPAAVNGEHAPLVAGQRAMVENSRPGAVRITRVNPHEIERQLAWSNPRVEFDGIDLGFAVGQMNRRNGAHLELADASIAELRVSGTFPANDPGTFARLIAETFGLVEESRGDGVIVLRQP